jgi:hypothetical protein
MNNFEVKKEMNSRRMIHGIGIVLAVALAFAMVTAPAMAREDDVTFYLNTSDGSHEATVAVGEEATVYVDLYGPVNKTAGFGAAVVYDPELVEIVDVTENVTMSNWYFWEACGNKLVGTNPELRYAKVEAVELMGFGPGNMRCFDITLRGNGSGITTIYMGDYPDDVDVFLNRTRVTDLIGDYKGWTLSEPFTVMCGSPETFSRSLAPGWNLISLPLTPLNDSTSAVLGNGMCTIVYGEVYSYDASTNQFVDVTTGTMETGVGYFVDVTTEGTWSYEGFANEELSIELSPGLNCIGWTNTSADILADGALDSIAGDYWYTTKLNVASQNYMDIYDAKAPSGVPEFIDFTTMDRGVGYFIAATSGCTLTYP